MALIRVGFDSDKGASLPQWSGSGPVSHHNTPTDRFDRRERGGELESLSVHSLLAL